MNQNPIRLVTIQRKGEHGSVSFHRRFGSRTYNAPSSQSMSRLARWIAQGFATGAFVVQRKPDQLRLALVGLPTDYP